MKEDIVLKLRRHLQKDIFEESDVVYILSRIRKILEMSGRQKEAEYKKLKFHCDWALHQEIDNTSPMTEELVNFPDDDTATYKFFTFVVFDAEFKKFLNEFKIETKIYSSRESQEFFHTLLGGIYKDTPLIIKKIKKQKVTLTEMRPAAREKLQDGTSVLTSGFGFTLTDCD